MQHASAGDLGRHHLAEVGFAHVDQELIGDGARGMDDAPHRAPALPVVPVQPGPYLLAVGDVDADGAYVRTEAFDPADHLDRRELRIGCGQLRPGAPRRHRGAAEQSDVPRAVFCQVRGHHAAERTRTSGDHVGRVGSELGGKGPGQPAARAQPGNQHRAAPKRDLVLVGRVVEQLPADERSDVGLAAARRRLAVDVDEATPVLGELLMAEHAAQSPHRRLAHTGHRRAPGRLRVRGDHEQPRRDGLPRRQRLDQPQHREGAELITPLPGHVQRPAVDDAGQVTVAVEVGVHQHPNLFR